MAVSAEPVTSPTVPPASPVPNMWRTVLLSAGGKAAFTAIALLGIFSLPGQAHGQDGLAIGDTAEAVVLETLDGEPVDLGEIFGRQPVLLEFWATWCGVCRALQPTMAAAHEAYGDEVEFIVVAAAVAQTRERVKQHMARHPMVGRMLWDTDGRFTRAFDAPGTGYVVILDGDGRVTYTGTGADQDLEAALERVLARR